MGSKRSLAKFELQQLGAKLMSIEFVKVADELDIDQDSDHVFVAPTGTGAYYVTGSEGQRPCVSR
jgi:hypothetical protein